MCLHLLGWQSSGYTGRNLCYCRPLIQHIAKFLHLPSNFSRSLCSEYTHWREMLNRWDKISCPCICTAVITSGKTEQSSKNWTKRRHSILQYFATISAITEWLVQYKLVNAVSFSRVPSKATHFCKMWEVSSGVWHVGDNLQSPMVFDDQWLHNASVLYRPDRNLACTVAMTTFVIL